MSVQYHGRTAPFINLRKLGYDYLDTNGSIKRDDFFTYNYVQLSISLFFLDDLLVILCLF